MTLSNMMMTAPSSPIFRSFVQNYLSSTLVFFFTQLHFRIHRVSTSDTLSPRILDARQILTAFDPCALCSCDCRQTLDHLQLSIDGEFYRPGLVTLCGEFAVDPEPEVAPVLQRKVLVDLQHQLYLELQRKNAPTRQCSARKGASSITRDLGITTNRVEAHPVFGSRNHKTLAAVVFGLVIPSHPLCPDP